MIRYRPATAQDVQAVTGRAPVRSMRALVFEEAGEPLGLAGLSVAENCQVIFFTGIHERVRRAPVTAMKAARHLLRIAARAGSPVYALADEAQPRSEAFLEHLGFERGERGVYRWTA